MAVLLSSLDALDTLAFDTVIDARSPAEYAEDHLPGAVSLPVLSNAERARVGTIYAQESPFRARRVGGALVARNVAAHIETALADKPRNWRPLVYCWRGGQRSGAFALILRQVGWQVDTLEGGWRAYRRLVQRALYQAPWPAPVVLLDGNTGTAKTEILALLAARGVQVLDLEGLAHHRGSLFGARPGGQPAQKGFESALAMARRRLDPARPVVIEAESSRIGRLILPPALWAAMQDAPRLVISAPLDARAAYLARRYRDVTENPQRLLATLRALAPLHPKDRIAAWCALAESGDFAALAANLMAHHYDPAYGRQRASCGPGRQQAFALPTLDTPALEAAADEIAAAIGALSPA